MHLTTSSLVAWRVNLARREFPCASTQSKGTHMNKLKLRWLGVPVAGLVVAGGAALVVAPAASAAPVVDSSAASPAHGEDGTLPIPLVSNIGDAAKIFTDHLQYEHLDQPLLGFGPAVQDPTGWVTGHLAPVFEHVIERAIAPRDDSGEHGYH